MVRFNFQNKKMHWCYFYYLGVSKKLENACKKRDCATIRPWIKSSVNHCYWVAASCGDDEQLKLQKWSSLVEHVTNQHDNCEHGPLNEERLWLRQGNYEQIKIVNTVVYKTFHPCSEKLCFYVSN